MSYQEASRKRRKQQRHATAAADGDREPAGAPEPAAPDAAAAGRGRPKGGPPPPPWGSFPLSELVILIGDRAAGRRLLRRAAAGPIMLGTGLVLGSLGGLELAVREHFAGYRSHTLLLAGFAGHGRDVGRCSRLTEIPPVVCLAAGVVVFGLCAWLLAGLFRRRSGGALFKIKG